MGQYFVVRADGQREGPFSEADIKAMASDGRIQVGDKVEDAATGSVWDPSVFAAAPTVSESVAKKGSNVALWILGGVILICGFCGIGVAAVLFPVFSQAKLAAQMTATLGDIKQSNTALLIYSTDFDDKMPPKMDSLDSAWPYLSPYAKMPLPQSNNPVSPMILGNPGLAGKTTTSIKDPSKTMTFFDSAPWTVRDVRITGFVDGSARRLPETDFRAATTNNFVVK